MTDPTYDYLPRSSETTEPIIVCEACGSIVVSEEVHTAWHRHVEKTIQTAAATTPPTHLFGR